MLKEFKAWFLGSYRVREIKARVRGKLVEAIPSRNKVSLNFIPNYLYPLHSFLLRRKSYVGFEFWRIDGSTNYFLFAKDRRTLEEFTSQLNAIYPNLIFKESILFPNLEKFACGAYILLKNGMKSLAEFAYDPISHLLEAMQSNSILQILFKAEKSKNKQELYFRVLIRLISSSNDAIQAREIVEHVANSFSVFSKDFDFSIARFPFFKNFLKRMIRRDFPLFLNFEYRKTFILSLNQLACLAHFPINPERYRRMVLSNEEGIKIGYVKFRGKSVSEALIPLKDFSRHVYVLGASGTGKSSLLINLVAQLKQKGICVHVIDPHGDMAYETLESVLPNDVIILDPLKVRFSINPFELPKYRNKYEREILIEKIIGQIVELMKRIFGKRYWGPSLNRTFQNVVRLLYKKDDSPTFEDILNVLKGRYEKLGSLVENESFRELQEELKKIPSERLDSVINKVDPFVKNSLLRMLFCNKKSSIDFEELLKPGKLVLWRISKAELSEQNMQMIGSAIITKLWLSVCSRPREKRNPVILVIDEFQNFSHLETLAIMITEGRKFGLGLILTHQHTKQLPESLLSEVLGNTATKIIFRISGEDAYLISKSLDIRFRKDLIYRLTSLPDGSAIVKFRAKFGEEPIEPFEIFTLKPLPRRRIDWNRVFEEMRERFGTSTSIQAKTQISEKLRKFLQIIDEVGDKGIRIISKYSKIEPAKVKRLLEFAEKEKLVEIRKVKTRGRPRIAVKLTSRGKEAIGKYLGRKGSLIHRKILEKVERYLKSLGYEVEVPLQGGRREQPDLIARGRGEVIAIEIESKADHPEQLRRNLEKNEWADRIIFIAPNQKVGQRIKKILGNVEVWVAKVCEEEEYE